MEEQEGNTKKRNLIAWLKEKTIQLWNTVKVWFSEKATNLWTLAMHKNLFWTLLFIGYFCFHSFLERLLINYLVLPFLSSFEVTFFTRILFLIGVIYIIVRTSNAWKEKKQISPSHLYVSLLLILVWIYYRFISDAFSFTSVIFCIAFVDIIALYAISFWVIYLVPFLKKEDKIVQAEQEKTDVQKEQENNKVEEGFILDEPIHENPKEDILKRSPFAESIANKLLQTKLSEGSFAIGIVAPWGYGKTSFVNLIKYHLGDRAIVMDYSPWVYGKGSDLTQAFFAELSKRLSCYNRSLHHQIKAYASMLGKTDSTILQLFSSVYALFHQDESLETVKGTLEKTLQSIPKPIVVVVDDLDRLIGEEIMEVLRLMRNGASFPNLYFIAAYDKNYIVKTISEQNKVIMPDAYLEKIFQVEYTIPQFEKEVLRNVLFESCSKFIVSDNDINNLKEAVYDSSALRFFVLEELRNLRDVKRFSNALHTTYSHLAGEVVLKDLMNITLLKVKYKEVFDVFSKYQLRLFQKNHYGALELYKGSNEEKKEQREKLQLFEPKEQINLQQDWNIYFGDTYTEVQKKDILFLLEKIFFRYSDDEELKGVNTEDGFERYFYDTLLEENFSADEFGKLWSLSFDEIKRKIKSALSSKSLSLQNQLKKFQLKDKDTYMKWVRTILYVGTNSTKNIFETNDLIKILNPPSYFKKEQNTYKMFLQKVLYENGSSKFVCKFLMNLEREIHWPLDLFTKEEAREIRLKMFKGITNLQETSFKELDDYMDLMGAIERTKNFVEMGYLDGAKDIYKRFCEQHIIPMVTSMIIPLHGSGTKRYGISQRAIAIWDSWENFEEFVRGIKTTQVNHNIDSKELDEFIRFMDEKEKEVKTGKNGVEFEFKYLNIGK